MIEIIVSSSILIVLILVIRKIFKGKITPLLRYSLWGVIVLRLLFPIEIMPFLEKPSSFISVMNVVETAISNVPDQVDLVIETSMDKVQSSNVKEVEPVIIKKEMIDWKVVFLTIWCIGFFIMLGWIIISNICFGIYLNQNSQRYQYNCKLPVYMVLGLVSPCLFFYKGKAGIYITKEMTEDTIRLEHIVAHELSHYRHGDHIWAFLRNILLSVYWYNPLVWVAAVVSRHDSELACDETAIRLLGEDNRIAYGRTLVGLISVKKDHKNFVCMATTMKFNESGIKERIKMIAKKQKMLAATGFLFAAILILVMAITFTGALRKEEESNTPKEQQKTEEDTMEVEAQIISISQENNTIVIAGKEERDMKMIGDVCNLSFDSKTILMLDKDGKEIDVTQLKENDLIKVVIEGGIQESYPAQAFASSIQLLQSKKKELTIETLKALLSKKEDLKFSDLEGYEGGNDIGSGVYVLEYPVSQGKFYLQVSGADLDKPPISARLIHAESKAEIDVYQGGYEEFLDKYTWEPDKHICINGNVYQYISSKSSMDHSKLEKIGEVKKVVDEGDVESLNDEYADHQILGAPIYKNGDMIITVWEETYLCYKLLYRNILEAKKDVTYSDSDIETAKQCVKTYFNEEAPERILKELWFDEEKGKAARKSYLLYGGGQQNAVEPKNVIVLFCNFQIDEKNYNMKKTRGMEGDYRDWMMILIRDSAKDDWRIDGQGY